MISDETATRMARKFFKEESVEALYTELSRIRCGMDPDDTFAMAVKVLGKKKARELYFKLPWQLKTYFLANLTDIPNQRFQLRMDKVREEFDDLRCLNRPEKSKRFADFAVKVEHIVLTYLEGSS